MKSIIEKFWIVLASGFGSGYSWFAPGTAGSFAAMILYFIIIYLAGPWWIIPVTILLFPLSIYAADRGEKYYKQKDARYITIDEFCGYFITVCYLPHVIKTAILGFFIFRIFDIIKPFPGRRCEKLNGGIGIVMDDVVAGIYGNILIRIIYHFWQ